MAINPPRWDVRPDGSVFISHRNVKLAELDQLASVRHLTLWNVTFDSGAPIAKLEKLQWLDIRGGTRQDLSVLEGCDQLAGVQINQVRNLTDISVLSELTGLRILSLYGLSSLMTLPEMGQLKALRRLELGQLRSLADWQGLSTPPALEELLFHNKLFPDLAVIEDLAKHPGLRSFEWIAPDEPARKVAAVRDLLHRDKATIVLPDKWLAENIERN